MDHQGHGAISRKGTGDVEKERGDVDHQACGAMRTCQERRVTWTHQECGDVDQERGDESEQQTQPKSPPPGSQCGSIVSWLLWELELGAGEPQVLWTHQEREAMWTRRSTRRCGHGGGAWADVVQAEHGAMWTRRSAGQRGPGARGRVGVAGTAALILGIAVELGPPCFRTTMGSKKNQKKKVKVDSKPTRVKRSSADSADSEGQDNGVQDIAPIEQEEAAFPTDDLDHIPDVLVDLPPSKSKPGPAVVEDCSADFVPDQSGSESNGISSESELSATNLTSKPVAVGKKDTAKSEKNGTDTDETCTPINITSIRYTSHMMDASPSRTFPRVSLRVSTLLLLRLLFRLVPTLLVHIATLLVGPCHSALLAGPHRPACLVVHITPLLLDITGALSRYRPMPLVVHVTLRSFSSLPRAPGPRRPTLLVGA
ncbi:hypothetical protein JB92DRAFT_3274505 [Gautieria morchelliformis]|nr:hypothetical protein JB92DRAFT_3274505 [Gautieria morchelliformis]